MPVFEDCGTITLDRVSNVVSEHCLCGLETTLMAHYDVGSSVHNGTIYSRHNVVKDVNVRAKVGWFASTSIDAYLIRLQRHIHCHASRGYNDITAIHKFLGNVVALLCSLRIPRLRAAQTD